MKFSAPNTEGGFTRAYDHGHSGPEGVQAALKAVWDDSRTDTAVLVVADHHSAGDKVHCVLTITIGDVYNEPRWRMADEDGESTLCHGFNLENAVAAAVYHLAVLVGQNPGSCIFRQ